MSALNNKRMSIDEAVELIEKADLKMLGIMEEHMLLPLVPISNELRIQLKEALIAAKIQLN